MIGLWSSFTLWDLSSSNESTFLGRSTCFNTVDYLYKSNFTSHVEKISRRNTKSDSHNRAKLPSMSCMSLCCMLQWETEYDASRVDAIIVCRLLEQKEDAWHEYKIAIALAEQQHAVKILLTAKVTCFPHWHFGGDDTLPRNWGNMFWWWHVMRYL